MRQNLPAILAGVGMFFLVAAPLRAEPGLTLPLACDPGRDCWPVRYVDHDPGPGLRDYRGGRRTEDGHNGTDLAIADRKRLAEGVAVLSAAAGVVLRTRDGEPDFALVEQGPKAVADRQCGNGLLIRHADGLETQYCHLRRGSIMVRQGDRLPAGALLGYVGMSGETSFPHLHFTVRRDGRVLDPFTAAAAGEDAAAWAPGLRQKLAYRPAVLTGIGIAVGRVERRDLEAGFHDYVSLPVTAPALVVWVRGFWFEKGNRFEFWFGSLEGSAGVDARRRIGRSRSFAFYYAGKKRPVSGWVPGSYRLRAVLRRGDEEVGVSRAIELLPQ